MLAHQWAGHIEAQLTFYFRHGATLRIDLPKYLVRKVVSSVLFRLDEEACDQRLPLSPRGE